GVGVQGKAVDTRTPRSREGRPFSCVAKPRADASHLLSRVCPTGDALLHGSRHGAGEFGGVLHQGVIAGRHHRVATRFEIPQRAELAHDPPTDRLDHGGDGGVGRRLTLDKPGLAACLSAIDVDALKKDTMEMEVEIERTAETLDKCNRPWVEVGSLTASGGCLVSIILPDRGADNRMDFGREVL